ncbi:hypothetical protein EDF38_0042 [Frigoribacterium sp. PhB160]|uniref:hypothetical protein n=1 Tax=Frigoribacterium sp. PhB160 TaxID=2485192 RepID=UPI000F45F4C7|nr:hypothetical protein [Frigoribacterium sp. PhB160]ROS60966.1 hypothetical protein EDF38_0042 [Frigoribacterium sp. PhB160]
MAKDKRRRRGSAFKRPLLIGGLALFLAVDVALVGYAVLGQGDAPSSDAYTPVPVASASDDPSESDAGSTTPEPTAVAVAAPTTYLSAVDESVAYRVAAGTCSATSRPVLEKTDDGGSTWIASTSTTDLSSVFRLQAVDQSYAYMVGLGGTSCLPGLTATYTSGSGFQTYPDRVASAWFLDPANPAVVHAPGGNAAAPCATGAVLAPLDDLRAALLCDDGVIYRTANSGVVWDAGTIIEGASSLAATGNGYVVAGRQAEDCAGVAVVGLSASSAGAAPVAVGCAAETLAAEDTTGPIAIAATDESVWIQLGGTVTVSADGGRTF